MLKGSENEPEGGDRKGGGKGLGALFAYRENPVSNRKGGISLRGAFWGFAIGDVVEVGASSGQHREAAGMKERRAGGRIARTISGLRGSDLLIPAS